MLVRRVVVVFVLLVAAAIALEPLIHTHPLSRAPQSPCALCVGTMARIAAPERYATAPNPVAAVATRLAPNVPKQREATPLPSRAPPPA